MTNSKPVISCNNVWKLFGFAPEKYLKTLSEDTSYEEIQADGYIAGVKDVSVDVFEGEMLVDNKRIARYTSTGIYTQNRNMSCPIKMF